MAADFFTVDTVLLKRLYVLFFIHLASRRILWAASTREPDAEWVTQQARNLFWELAEEGIGIKITSAIASSHAVSTPCAGRRARGWC